MKTRLRILSVLVVALLVGGCGLWVWQAKRQYALNRVLITLKAPTYKMRPAIVRAVQFLPHPRTHTAEQWATASMARRRDNRPPWNTFPREPFLAPQEGDTPLMYAAQNRKTAAVQTLLAQGAVVNARNENGETALMLAAKVAGNTAVVQLLMAHGADVDAHTRAGETALMRAAYTGDTECVTLLLNKGANINAEAEVRGMGTPLMYAVIAGHLPVIKLLLARGANPNYSFTPIVAHPQPTSPLSYARDSHRNDIVALLKKAGTEK